MPQFQLCRSSDCVDAAFVIQYADGGHNNDNGGSLLNGVYRPLLNQVTIVKLRLSGLSHFVG